MEPILRAMYGPQETVSRYTVAQVMRELKADVDGQRLQDWTNYEWGKMREAEAKMRRRSR